MPAEWGGILSLGLQIPIVLAFIWFTFEMTKRHNIAVEKIASQHAEEGKRRDEQMQAFLREQREQNRSSMDKLALLIEKIDVSIELHDRKMDAGLTRMEERTRQRGAELAFWTTNNAATFNPVRSRTAHEERNEPATIRLGAT